MEYLGRMDDPRLPTDDPMLDPRIDVDTIDAPIGTKLKPGFEKSQHFTTNNQAQFYFCVAYFHFCFEFVRFPGGRRFITPPTTATMKLSSSSFSICTLVPSHFDLNFYKNVTKHINVSAFGVSFLEFYEHYYL